MSKKTSNQGQTPAQPTEALRFEDAVGELELIIERIESGEIDLDRALREHERGVALIKRCREMLALAEQRVQQLVIESGEGARPGGRDEAPER